MLVMKKNFRRISGIILMLFLYYQQFSYAVIITNPVEELIFNVYYYFKPIALLIGFISVIVLMISALSFFSLKSTIKKQNMPGYDSENLVTLNSEDIEKKQNRIQWKFYIWSMILSIIGYTYLRLYFLRFYSKTLGITFFIPIILFIISLIFRLCKKKKISNIIFGISVALVCTIALWNFASNKIIENYNHQFFKYQHIEGVINNELKYVSDIEGLINAAIDNNKTGRKVTLIYQNTNYTSTDELKQLLSKLNKSKKYLVTFNYGKNHYIESITLRSYLNKYIRDLQRI